MKDKTSSKSSAIACCLIIFVLALVGLIFGMQCLDDEGWGRLGGLVIAPSVAMLLSMSLDFIVTTGVIEKGVVCLSISIFIKLSGMAFAMWAVNLGSILVLLILFAVAAYPSIYNINRLRKSWGSAAT